jgi:hypothetical protein
VQWIYRICRLHQEIILKNSREIEQVNTVFE